MRLKILDKKNFGVYDCIIELRRAASPQGRIKMLFIAKASFYFYFYRGLSC